MNPLAVLWHFFIRVLRDYPTSISNNWLGILLPLAIYILILAFDRTEKGWSRMLPKWDAKSKAVIVTYALLFLWVVFRDVYQDHVSMSKRLIYLNTFAAHEEDYDHRLKAAEAKADQWQDSYIQIAKGEITPDRNLNRDEMDRLHDKLTDYAKHSGDKRYSTVRIGPAFAVDGEAEHFAEQLLKVFHDAQWTSKPEFEHDKRLLPLLYAEQSGVVIFTDDPHNQGLWIMWTLKDAGIDSYIAEDTPSWFKGTLICIEGKQKYEHIQWW